MTIEQKWASLFHHTLQSEKLVTPKLAKEAWLLISWAFDLFVDFNTSQGYAISIRDVNIKDTICSFLVKKAAGKPISEFSWPVKEINIWQQNKPFHLALGTNNLKSDWHSFYVIASRRYKIDINSCI